IPRSSRAQSRDPLEGRAPRRRNPRLQPPLIPSAVEGPARRQSAAKKESRLQPPLIPSAVEGPARRQSPIPSAARNPRLLLHRVISPDDLARDVILRLSEHDAGAVLVEHHGEALLRRDVRNHPINL